MKKINEVNKTMRNTETSTAVKHLNVLLSLNAQGQGLITLNRIHRMPQHNRQTVHA